MGNHRADLMLYQAGGHEALVVELQHSPISVEEVRERESFYGNMIWILDGNVFRKRFELRTPYQPSDYYTFRWKHPVKTWAFATKPVFIDFPKGVFSMRSMGKTCPVGGWGHLYDKTRFIRSLGA